MQMLVLSMQHLEQAYLIHVMLKLTEPFCTNGFRLLLGDSMFLELISKHDCYQTHGDWKKWTQYM